MNSPRDRIQSKWRDYIEVVPSAYRALAFTVATAQVFLFPGTYELWIPPATLFIAVGIYTLIKTLYPLRWYGSDILSQIVLWIDLAVAIFLIMTTGGLNSPFVLYSVTPVLTAALVNTRKVTISIACISIAGMLAAQLVNPLPQFPLSFQLGYLFLYGVGVCLTAALPYLINVNFRQHLHSESALQERRRLSLEIHDGLAQTLTGLRWQTQLIQRRLSKMGIELDEVGQVTALAEKAHQDVRKSLALLRNQNGKGGFLLNLKDCLKNLNQDANIEFDLDVETDELHLEPHVELELLYICKEALTNIKKHSQARKAQVKLALVNNYLKVSITDNGGGFDAVAYYNDGVEAKGHGLAIMQERAESIGGRFRVLSLPGQGTEVQVEVPAHHRRS